MDLQGNIEMKKIFRDKGFFWECLDTFHNLFLSLEIEYLSKPKDYFDLAACYHRYGDIIPSLSEHNLGR